MNRIAQQFTSTVAAVRDAAPHRWSVALRALLCVTIPLLVGLAIGHPAQGGQASFGGLAGLYVTDAPFRYRARVVATIGAGLALFVFLGGLAGALGWAVAAGVAGLVAGLSSFVSQAAELPPPRELMLVMTVLAATEIPTDLTQALGRAGLTAAGGAFAVLVSVSPLALGVRKPETRALAAALTAVARFMQEIGTPDEAAARHTAVLAVRRAALVAEQGGAPADHRLARLAIAIEALVEASLHAAVESSGRLDPYWSAAVRALVPAVSTGDLPPTLMIVGGGPGGAALTAACAELSRALLGAPTHPTMAEDPEPQLPPWPGLLPQLRAAARGGSVITPAAVRIGIAVALGVGIGSALGVAHAYWVGLTACAVLQASNLSLTRSRFFYRVIGTVIGVGLVFGLLSGDPPLIVVMAAVAVFQALIEVVIIVNYGLAVVGITVLALLLFHIGAPAVDVGSVIGERLIDTGVGALLALVLRTVLWPRATSARVPDVQARVLRTARRVLDALWSSSAAVDQLADQRRQLRGDIAALRAVQADALADSPRVPRDADLQWPVTVAVEDLAIIALSVPTHRLPPPTEDAQAFLTGLDDLARALLDESAPPPRPPATLPGFPRTTAALNTLHRVVADSR